MQFSRCWFKNLVQCRAQSQVLVGLKFSSWIKSDAWPAFHFGYHVLYIFEMMSLVSNSWADANIIFPPTTSSAPSSGHYWWWHTNISTGTRCWDFSGSSNVLEKDMDGGGCEKVRQAKVQQHYLLVQRELQLETASEVAGHGCPHAEFSRIKQIRSKRLWHTNPTNWG